MSRALGSVTDPLKTTLLVVSVPPFPIDVLPFAMNWLRLPGPLGCCGFVTNKLKVPVAPPTAVVASIRTPLAGTTTFRRQAVPLRLGQVSFVASVSPRPLVTTRNASNVAVSFTSRASPVLAFTE